MSDQFLSEPPVVMDFSDEEIVNIRNNRLILKHPCHSQAVKRCVKDVSEASSQVARFERRDGHMRQTLRSRKLLKRFEAKKDFIMG